MNIGRASKASGLPLKTIRYYESIGLVVAQRRSNGYRHYTDDDIRRLRFIRRARCLGFSISDCRALLSLDRERKGESAEIRKIAQARLSEIDRKLTELRSVHAEIVKVLDAPGDAGRPARTILEGVVP